ncbi:MAG: hypothetical protein JSU09_08545 [Bacteroidetes bacterium]|nr:hypothetical protein [Bacteroidota bacterium]
MQAFVDSSSKAMVSSGARVIKATHLAHSRLLDPTNPLLGNDLDRVVTDHHSGTRSITQDEAASFLASSSLCHAIDGWIYLAHAVDSFLKGDKGISVHLAYYSELRGAMSFLSSEGIATLNHHHICVTNTGQVNKFNNYKGTHNFAWEALDKYILSNNKQPKDDILRVFSYQGKNFQEWLKAIPNSSSIMADQVIKVWLRQWSFDVNLFKSDKDLRNEVSYRPRKLSENTVFDIGEALRKLSSFWYLLEPSNSERFRMLDQHLLKKFIKKIHGHIEVSLGRTVDFETLLEDTFSTLRLTLSPSQRSFFTSISDHDLFVSAGNTVIDPVKGINPISIIARSTLLLRLAITYSSNNLINAGVTRAELNFFLNNIGINNGFWQNNSMPTDLTELWNVIGESIASIDSWLGGRTVDASLSELNSELSFDISHYKQMSRASFWGTNF